MFSFLVGTESLVPLHFPITLGRSCDVTGTQSICWWAGYTWDIEDKLEKEGF